MPHANQLSSRVIVLTGAANGIGAAAARAMAAAGGRLVLLDVDAEALARLASELGSSVVIAKAVDVRDFAGLEGVAAELLALDLGVDVLVNNAGVYAQGPLLELPAGELERCLEVNLLGLVRCCRAFVPLMRQGHGGQVINVLSEFAWLPFPNKGSYCVSKAAAAMASACLRSELARRGVRVTDFVPPAVDTGLVRRASTGDPPALAREVEVVRRHGTSARAVGEAIAKVIARPRDRVVLGFTQRMAILGARLAPALARRLAWRAAVRLGLAPD